MCFVRLCVHIGHTYIQVVDGVIEPLEEYITSNIFLLVQSSDVNVLKIRVKITPGVTCHQYEYKLRVFVKIDIFRYFCP